MRGMVRKGASVVLIAAVIALIYSLYSFISVETGDGMAGYLTKDDRLFSVDYTNCKSGNVAFTLRNLDSVEVNTASEVEVIRDNDGAKIIWDAVIPPGETGTFNDKCEIKDNSFPCKYVIKSKKYGMTTKISILCS